MQQMKYLIVKHATQDNILTFLAKFVDKIYINAQNKIVTLRVYNVQMVKRKEKVYYNIVVVKIHLTNVKIILHQIHILIWIKCNLKILTIMYLLLQIYLFLLI